VSSWAFSLLSENEIRVCPRLASPRDGEAWSSTPH
jgi:hypothetical protein